MYVRRFWRGCRHRSRLAPIRTLHNHYDMGRRWVRIAIIAALAALAVGVVGFLWWAQPQPLLPEATAALASTPDAAFTQGTDGRLTYAPTGVAPTTGLVLYPAGRCRPRRTRRRRARWRSRAISWRSSRPVQPGGLRHRRRQGGHRRSPGDRLLGRRRSFARWLDGGPVHRLAPRSRRGAGAVGVVLRRGPVGRRGPGRVGLRDARCRASASYTSPEHLALLGSDVVLTPIEGGNHEQMGWYTGQPNDPPATISRDEQQRQVVGRDARPPRAPGASGRQALIESRIVTSSPSAIPSALRMASLSGTR